MSLDKSQKEIAVKLLLEKSERNLEQAVGNANLGYWDLVANRLYYSIFHAVNAMLLLDGIKTGSHKGSSIQFGRSYILTGKFKREDGIFFSRLQTMREKADYQNIFSLSEDEGTELIKQTRTLYQRMSDYIKDKLEKEN